MRRTFMKAQVDDGSELLVNLLEFGGTFCP